MRLDLWPTRMTDDQHGSVRGLDAMKSINFEFLRPRWGELASLAVFAEQYIHSDPSSALVKLRSFAEQLVKIIYHKYGLPPLYQENLNDLLNNSSFQQIVPRVVVSKLHAIRIHGNKAAHGDTVSKKDALWLLKEAYELGCWLHIAEGGGCKADCGQYAEPPADWIDESKQQLKREKKAVLERLAAQEAEMARLLADLEQARAQAATAQASVAQMEAARNTGEAAASTLDFDETTTRKQLIDAMLADAGWDVGANGNQTSSVRQEFEVAHQPTATGLGYADYVLMGADGKPVAVIEAKKTSCDVEKGRAQAKCYADGLEKMYNKRPIIFCTNGYDISIWNDAENEPPRPLFGFYSPDSLQYLHYQRTQKQLPTEIAPDLRIAGGGGRNYQLQAVKQVIERFAAKHRRALIVQATGTGKTRVAISLCDALVRAKWAKRILFLCDRRELRKQANNVFKEHLPGEPRVYVTSSTSADKDKRIYLATYPAMMKCYASFDVGFFDLIIADESHRSIYNRYRDLLKYFDAYVVGLTATPRKDLLNRNTYELFGCENDDPTAFFGFEEAINYNPPCLVPFRVQMHTTFFLREGIKYSKMTDQQRQQLESGETEPEEIEYERNEVDKQVFNKDTNRKILRNLMENGIKIKDGTQLGKSIIFARNHNHAVLMQNLFYELYPQYGGSFCRVIDNYDPRAEQLIDDFKGLGKKEDEITIAISVDMLDTGIDVPEVVNLVFAKPVFSYVKFWQMIGRGTRLCKNLLAPGKDKKEFQIFDHWGVFKYFDEEYKEVEVTPTKSLLHRLFEARVQLAQTALDKANLPAFDLVIDLVGKDIRDLPEKTIAVREKWRQVKTVERPEILKQFDAATKACLTQDIAPLMQWRDISGHETAHKFDLLVCRLQTELLQESSRFADLKDELLNQVEQLEMNLSQVRAKADIIAAIRNPAFWNDITVDKLEDVRKELRGIMQYRQIGGGGWLPPKVIDVAEDDSLIERGEYKPRLEGLDLAAYRIRVDSVLKGLFETNQTLQRIKNGEPVTEEDLQALVSLVLTQDQHLNLADLMEYYPETAGHLDLAIRSIIGMESAVVHERFSRFIQQHPTLNSRQMKFIEMLQNHIAKYGSIEIDRLYEAPFTSLHAEGIDGIFQNDGQIDDLLQIIESFRPPRAEKNDAETRRHGDAGK